MKTLKEFLDALKAKRAALVKAASEWETTKKAAEAKPDDQAAKTAAETNKKAWTDLHTEIEGLAGMVEEATRIAEEHAHLDEVEKKALKLASTASPTDGGGLGGDPATVRDGEKEEAEYENLFFKFMKDEDISKFGDVARDAMMPTFPTLREKVVSGGNKDMASARIPARVWARMVGKTLPSALTMAHFMAALRGKAIPMLSSDPEGSGGRASLVWPEYSPVIAQLPPENPNVYDRVAKRTVPTNEWKEPRLVQSDGMAGEYGGVAVSRGTEGADASDTEIVLEQVTIKTYPLDAYTEFSQRFLRLQRVDLEQEFVNKLGAACIRRANYEIIHGTGDGGKQILGLRQDADVNLVPRQGLGAVIRKDLTNLKYTLRPALRAAGTFCIADQVEEALEDLTVSADGTTDRRPLFQATTADGVWDRLCNKAWFTGTDMPAIGAVGDVIFGNFPLFLLLWLFEAVVSRSTHFQFKKGLISLRLDAECGGRAIEPAAFAVLSGSTS